MGTVSQPTVGVAIRLQGLLMSEKASYASLTARRWNGVTTTKWLQRPGEPQNKVELLSNPLMSERMRAYSTKDDAKQAAEIERRGLLGLPGGYVGR